MKKMFPEIPVLNNGQIELRALTQADAEALEEMVNSRRVYRYLPTFLFEKKYPDVREVIRRLYTECLEESLILGVFSGDGSSFETFCGLAEMYGFRDPIHKISVGYRLLGRYWGKGIATEALGLMIDYLFNETDIELITASTLPGNTASANVLKKNGFVLAASGTDEAWGYEDPLPTNVWFRKKQPGEGADRL